MIRKVIVVLALVACGLSMGPAFAAGEGRANDYLLSLSPARHGTDGFFAAVLERRA